MLISADGYLHYFTVFPPFQLRFVEVGRNHGTAQRFYMPTVLVAFHGALDADHVELKGSVKGSFDIGVSVFPTTNNRSLPNSTRFPIR